MGADLEKPCLSIAVSSLSLSARLMAGTMRLESVMKLEFPTWKIVIF